jgi:hypothetical protein
VLAVTAAETVDLATELQRERASSLRRMLSCSPPAATFK